jgi:hypothetical protein
MVPVLIGMLVIIPSTLSSLAAAGQLYSTTTFDPCDSACQALEQFSQDISRAREEASEEQGQEAIGEQTLDDLMAEAEEEDEFDHRRAAQEQQENGIEDAENIPSARLLRFDIVLKNELLNQTFARILNNNTTSETPEIEEFEEKIDSDGTTAQRQIISYEFNPDISEDDDIRIYTAAGQTVQNLSSVLATNINTTSIKMFENGKMVITCDGENSFDEADDTRIYAPHNYTAANGYRYVNSTIFDAAGNEVLKTGPPDLSQYMGTESAC